MSPPKDMCSSGVSRQEPALAQRGHDQGKWAWAGGTADRVWGEVAGLWAGIRGQGCRGEAWWWDTDPVPSGEHDEGQNHGGN